MNLIKRSLTLLVVMALTSQALMPELSYASGTIHVVDESNDFEDTEEEEEEAPAQSSYFAYNDPSFIVPVVIAVIVAAATIRYFLKNRAALPLVGAGFAALPQGNLPQMPAPALNQERGSNQVMTDTALVAAAATRVLTPGQTPMRQRNAQIQEVQAEVPVDTLTRVGKKVVFVDQAEDEAHTPVLPPTSSKKKRTDTPARRVDAPAPISPFVAVLNFGLNDVQPMQIDQAPAPVLAAHSEFDEEEEEDVARARRGKKKGAATAVKRGRRNADQEAVAAAAPLTANLGGKRARRTGVNYRDE